MTVRVRLYDRLSVCVVCEFATTMVYGFTRHPDRPTTAVSASPVSRGFISLKQTKSKKLYYILYCIVACSS